MCILARSLWLGLVLALVANSLGWAQAGDRPGRNPAAALSQRFKSAPEVGQSLPDLTLYDGDGQKLSLGDLKGNYSVVVFGCLT